MTSPRDAYHHGDLRNALVAAAVQLIAQQGPDTFSLREAAREVGVSANAAYRHFEDKAALLTAVAANGFDMLTARMQQAMALASQRRTKQPASVARFKAVGRAYVAFALEHPAIFRVMFGAHGAACRHQETGEAEAQTPWTLLGRSLDALVSDGMIALEQRPGAELKAWAVVHGFASLALDGLSADAPEGALEALLDFAVVGLCGETQG